MKACRILVGIFSAIAILYIVADFSRARAEATEGSSYGITPCGGYAGTYGTGGVTTQAYVVGDLNGDGHVNVVDLLILADTWALSASVPGFNPEADFNCDGTINGLDMAIFAGTFGT